MREVDVAYTACQVYHLSGRIVWSHFVGFSALGVLGKLLIGAIYSEVFLPRFHRRLEREIPCWENVQDTPLFVLVAELDALFAAVR